MDNSLSVIYFKQHCKQLIHWVFASISLLLVACGGESDNEQEKRIADPFSEIEAILANNNVSTATTDGMWVLVYTVDETVQGNEGFETEGLEKYDYVRYQTLQLNQDIRGAVSFDNCAASTPALHHVLGYDLSTTSLTINDNQFFNVGYKINAVVTNNTIIDLGEFAASTVGNNDIKYKAKIYKFRDDMLAPIGSVDSSAGAAPMYCFMFDTGERTALFTEGAGTVPFHMFSINNNGAGTNFAWLRSTEEQSVPVASDMYFSIAGSSYSQNRFASFSFNESTFPNYSGNFLVADETVGTTSGTFTINLSN